MNFEAEKNLRKCHPDNCSHILEYLPCAWTRWEVPHYLESLQRRFSPFHRRELPLAQPQWQWQLSGGPAGTKTSHLGTQIYLFSLSALHSLCTHQHLSTVSILTLFSFWWGAPDTCSTRTHMHAGEPCQTKSDSASLFFCKGKTTRLPASLHLRRTEAVLSLQLLRLT